VRIVHAANFSQFKYGANYYFTDDKISNGLIRNGHYVYNFSCRDVARSENWFKTKNLGAGRANKKLIETCINVKPDLLLLGHSENITAETLEKIKSNTPEIKIALWYVDPLFHLDHLDHIVARLPYINVLFATTSGELLKNFKTKSNAISYLPNISDVSVEPNKNFEKETLEIDFIFCGRDYKEPDRQLFLKTLQLNLSSCKTKFCGCLGEKGAFGSDYVELLGASSMGLNYSRRNDVYLYSSDRIVQLSGNGILTFCPRVPGFDLLYTDDEIVYFDDLDDLTQKILLYKSDHRSRRTMAMNGWKKTHTSFNTTRVTKFMLELIFEQPLSEEYEWKREIFY
jgi:hypothetical protein